MYIKIYFRHELKSNYRKLPESSEVRKFIEIMMQKIKDYSFLDVIELPSKIIQLLSEMNKELDNYKKCENSKILEFYKNNKDVLERLLEKKEIDEFNRFADGSPVHDINKKFDEKIRKPLINNIETYIHEHYKVFINLVALYPKLFNYYSEVEKLEDTIKQEYNLLDLLMNIVVLFKIYK